MSIWLRPQGAVKHKAAPIISVSHTALPTVEIVLSTGLPTGTTFGGGTYVQHTKKSDIVYTNATKTNPGRSNWCEHTREEYTGPSANIVTQVNHPTVDRAYRYNGDHNILGKTLYDGAYTQILGILGPNGRGYLDTGVQGWINEAIAKFKPDLKKASLPNFLIDIGQMKDLLSSIKEVGELTVTTAKVLSAPISDVRKLSKGLVKRTAGLNLAYNFGWKPTRGDLLEILSGMTGLAMRLKAFENQLNKIFTSSLVNVENSIIQHGTYTSGSHFASWGATLHQTVTSYVAYRPKPLMVMGDLSRTVFGVLDTYGFEADPRIIWDAIPFSFVVDWFLNVGDYLARFKIDALELPVEYVDTYVQLKERITMMVTPYGVDTFIQAAPKNTLCGGHVYQRDYFNRRPIVPDLATFQGLKWKMPTPKQLLLGLSLGAVLHGT